MPEYYCVKTFVIELVQQFYHAWAQFCYKMWGGQLDLKPI